MNYSVYSCRHKNVKIAGFDNLETVTKRIESIHTSSLIMFNRKNMT